MKTDMYKVLSEYELKADTNAKKIILEILRYAVTESDNGSSIKYVKDKTIADEVYDIIFDEIGDYLLDVEMYEEDGVWCIDCVFGTDFVPNLEELEMEEL